MPTISQETFDIIVAAIKGAVTVTPAVPQTFEGLVKARSITGAEFYPSIKQYAAPGDINAAVRFITRAKNPDMNEGGGPLGVIVWETTGPYSQTGTTNLKAASVYLSGTPMPPGVDPQSEFQGATGIAVDADGNLYREVEVRRPWSGAKQADANATEWVNLKTGEVSTFV